MKKLLLITILFLLKPFIVKRLLVVAMLCISSISFSQNFDFQGLSYSVNSDPATVTITGRAAGNTNLDIVIPAMATDGANVIYTVTNIGAAAFSNNQLTSVIIPDSVIDIGNYAFSQNQLTSVTMGTNVTSIGFGAFRLNQLTNITIPESVSSIGGYAFNNNDLTSVTIPNNVTTMGDSAFFSNPVSTVTIGSGITSIGGFAFSFVIPTNPNSGQHSLTFLGSLPPTIQSDSFLNSFNQIRRGDISVTVSCSALTNYTNNPSYTSFFGFTCFDLCTFGLSFTAPADLCLNAGVQNGLGGGLLVGGVYSGPGVTDDGNGTTYSFDPAVAGVGTHPISYTYTDGTGCTDSAIDTIEVFAVPNTTFTAPADVCLNADTQTGLSGGTPAVTILSTTVTLNIGYDVFGFGGFVGGDIVFDSSGAMLSTDVTANNGASGSTANLVNATALDDTITLTFDNGQTPNIVADTTIIGASGTINFISGTDFTVVGDLLNYISGNATASTDLLGTRLYTGPGVTNDANGITYSFNPAIAGVGIHTITYTYTNANGCTATASDTIEVFALDTVTFSAPTDVCLDAGVQTGLGNATPSGGVYSGPGVIDDGNGTTYSFDPTVASTGVHTITYDITNANGCSVSASDTIEVFAIDDASFSYDASMYGCDVAYPTPTITGLEGGTFSAGTGLAINPNTGEIDTATTTPGTYTVTYTTAGNCINSSSVTITFTTSCMAATAFNFDGVDDYAVATNPSVLDITTGTIEMRIKPQTKTTSQTILGYRNSTGSSTKYLFNLLENLTGIGFWNGNIYLTIPFTFNENQWYNIAITDDNSGSTTVYVDGTAIGAFASEFSTATGANLNLYVGVDVDFPTNEYFLGDIGDIRIWNTVKVGGTALCTPTPSGTDLIAHYNFNQGFENSNNSSVNSILDTSSNANNLQLTNVALTGATSNWVNTDTTIFDTVFPTVITQDITLNLTCSTSTTITAANINNGSFDNCGIASITIDIDTFDISMLGPNTVTLSVTDFYGNESTQTAQVTVVDNIRTRLYVNQSATSDFDGSSWEKGFIGLPNAIVAARNCASVTEIWVASGTYTPNSFPFNNTITAGISNRDFTFHLLNGVKIYGGFNATETSIDQRDIASNPTILSGNIGNQSSSADNVYHVVTSVLDNAETRLDGFIIEGGLTTFNEVTGLTIEGIDVRRRLGAGISNHNSSAVFANLIIRNNTADIGAGIYNKQTINTSYTNVVIHNNNTVGFGIGGGMYNQGASFTATNVVLANNVSDAGPAIYNDSSSSATLTNLTIFNNTSPSTGLTGSALIANSSSAFTITNTVLYNNTRDIGLGNNSTVSGTNNYVLTNPTQFGSPAGFTQLIADPFTNSADIDGLDNVFGTADDGLLPSETGVLIDSGDTASNSQTTDITREIRNLGTAIDVGAYEYQFKLILIPKVNLQGALLGNTNGLMRDDLRTAGYLPTTSPYPDGLTCDASVFSGGSAAARGGFSQNDIVDWIWIELRDESDNTTVIASTSALLQRDGDVVAVDGFSNIEFSIPYNSFYITLKHRNHLGVMTANTVQLDDTPTSVDFTDASNPIAFGTNAQATVMLPLLNRPTSTNWQKSNQSNNVLALWAGNANGDTVVQYSGTSPDTPSILSEVLNDSGNFLNFPTYTVSGYNNNDIDMNGNSQYSGTAPDTPFILQNVLAHPGNFLNFSTYGIQEQLPEN